MKVLLCCLSLLIKSIKHNTRQGLDTEQANATEPQGTAQGVKGLAHVPIKAALVSATSCALRSKNWISLKEQRNNRHRHSRPHRRVHPVPSPELKRRCYKKPHPQQTVIKLLLFFSQVLLKTNRHALFSCEASLGGFSYLNYKHIRSLSHHSASCLFSVWHLEYKLFRAGSVFSFYVSYRAKTYSQCWTVS